MIPLFKTFLWQPIYHYNYKLVKFVEQLVSLSVKYKNTSIYNYALIMIPSQIHKPLYILHKYVRKEQIFKNCLLQITLKQNKFSNLLFSTLSHLLIKQSHSHKNIWSYIKRIEYHVDQAKCGQYHRKCQRKYKSYKSINISINYFSRIF